MGPLSWNKVTPRPREDALTWMVTSLVLSKYWRELVEVIGFLNLCNGQLVLRTPLELAAPLSEIPEGG